jgi:Tol biopolymer transport system component
MNLSGGEPRRVTNDSDVYIDRADISPDGSQIIYGPNKGNTRQIRSISALGSDRKILFENATFPVWQPDGKRIFFFRGLYAGTVSTSNKLEIWSGKPDGPEERLEFIDTVSTKDRIALSVSPDGKSVAWTRTIPAEEIYQEVFTHNLETGKERQLTFDKKKIDEVCWANNNNIIYNTNKGGNTNLWMVPATGGTPTQITKGIGPDRGIRISADSKRLLCYQNQTIGNLWIMSLQDASARQITFDESNRVIPSLSPDGKQIAYTMADPDPMKNLWKVYLTDRDGTNRRRVGSSDQLNVFPSWSPDGRWLSFVRWNPELSPDDPKHLQCYVVDVAQSNAPKYLVDGVPQWISQDEVVTWTSVKSWIVSVMTGERKQFFEDSTNALPVMGGKYILYKDLRNGREGVWIVDSKLASSKARRLLPGKLINPIYRFILSMSYNQSRNEMVYLTRNHELWKMHVPDGRKERIQSSFGGFFSIAAFQSRGNEIVYADSRSHSRLVLIENLFK